MADPATSVHGADRTAPKIGVFDATMLVMGGIVGAGIFSNPSVVAKMVHSGLLMMVVWSIGGVIALAGAFVYAELAARHPATGGHYAYMRDAFHPAIAFMFGWAILLVVQTGGIAAVSVIFARYFLAVVPLKLSETTVAVLALALLTGINCANLKAGNRTQSLFMVLKVIALVAIIGCGIAIMTHGTGSTTMTGTMPEHPWRALAAAFTPVMFAYGGWQTASFAAGDMRNPARDLSRAMLYGVVGVVALYLAVNAAFLLALGADGLASTVTPAAAVVDHVSSRMHIGAEAIAACIALSTFGFLSQGMFATPRVYQAMAADGLFFKVIARISPRSHTPVTAIALQGTLCAIVAASGSYESIMSYVTSVDFIFYGLAALALFIFRARDRNRVGAVGYTVPGHPWTTGFFMIASWIVVGTTIYSDPRHSLIGIAALCLGVPTYFVWMKVRKGDPKIAPRLLD
ncbi:MAG TPA: amino acid permease [Gemmatimonadaceae bacterium]|jgi:APA family basic amino acid/polyamine antiporter